MEKSKIGKKFINIIMLTQSGSSINDNPESTDDGFDVDALFKGKSKLYI